MGDIIDIGGRLVATRRAKGITQQELGELLGVRQQQIARWESTSYRLASLERVDTVASTLGVGWDSAQEAPTEAKAFRVEDGLLTARPVLDLGEVAARIRSHGQTLAGDYHIERIGVFGSFAHGGQHSGSDVDLLLHVENPGGFRSLEAAQFMAGILGREVDAVRPESLKEQFWPRVMKDVVYIWHA